MLDPGSNNELPPIPAKRYFTIGEVSDLCLVKPHVLRYWEQEFPNLKPVKRRGNRRYYQRHDVLVIRQIRGLLYDQGFTIGGARQRIEGDAQRELAKPEVKPVVASISVDARLELIRGLREDLESVLALLQ
jgi:DNA-binding transcriptional MerR regulator